MSEHPTHVLLVDDEEELVDFLSKRLRRKGLEVTAMTSGKAAVKEAEDTSFDVAILDLKMPEMDGLQVLRRIKEIQPFMQVIMLTGHGSLDTALESGRYDAFRFLAKPADFDDLLSVVQEAHAHKRALLSEGFNNEIGELISGSLSPHDILSETKRLRKKYEQE